MRSLTFSEIQQFNPLWLYQFGYSSLQFHFLTIIFRPLAHWSINSHRFFFLPMSLPIVNSVTFAPFRRYHWVQPMDPEYWIAETKMWVLKTPVGTLLACVTEPLGSMLVTTPGYRDWMRGNRIAGLSIRSQTLLCSSAQKRKWKTTDSCVSGVSRTRPLVVALVKRCCALTCAEVQCTEPSARLSHFDSL